MNSEQYKVLAAALALDSFTARALSERAGVNINTVKAWLRRHDSLVEATGERAPATSRGGRRAAVWRARDGAREEMARTLDLQWGEFRGELLTPEDAMAAFADPEARVWVRKHLRRAARADDEAQRAQHLEQAREWFEHEQDLVADWRRNGFEPPADIAAEHQELQDQLDAFEIHVDRLRFDRRVADVQSTATWLVTSLNGWFQTAGHAASAAFDPLRLRRDGASLEGQLATVVRMADQVADVSHDQLVVAMVVALGRSLRPDARVTLCETLLELTLRNVGAALRAHFGGPPGGLVERRDLLHVLAGMEDWPRLVFDDGIGAWFDSLQNSSHWADELAPFYVELAQYRPNAVRRFLLEGKYAPLTRISERISEHDREWDLLVTDLREPRVGFLERIRRWLAEFGSPGGPDWQDFSPHSVAARLGGTDMTRAA
jgi:hypothetical protein